ncbi:hypothetical protein U4R67_21580, partial [Klebsiella pneumoniae]
MAWSQGLSGLSIYAIISVTYLVKSGSADTAVFRLAMMSNPEKAIPILYRFSSGWADDEHPSG